MTDRSERERRLSRLANAQRLRLEKSRRRDANPFGGGAYLLSDPFDNDRVILGGGFQTFSATLDDVEAYLTRGGK